MTQTSQIKTQTLRLGVSSYSYWHFTPEKVPLSVIVDKAADSGVMGLEILHQQLESEENGYLQDIKRQAFRRGLALYNLGTSQNFIAKEKAEREEQVRHTKHCIDLAHALGVPSIRVNAGTWQTPGGPGLVESRGWTQPWDGFSDEDGFAWAIEGLGACVDYAKEQGVMLLLENHWGLTTTAAGMIRVLEGVGSPWLRAILDMGNFYYDGDMYGPMEQVAPYVDLAHAKTYPGGGLVFTIEIDFAKVFRILKNAGFQGYVSVEMEGKEHADTAVPKSIEVLKEAWEKS